MRERAQGAGGLLKKGSKDSRIHGSEGILSDPNVRAFTYITPTKINAVTHGSLWRNGIFLVSVPNLKIARNK